MNPDPRDSGYYFVSRDMLANVDVDERSIRLYVEEKLGDALTGPGTSVVHFEWYDLDEQDDRFLVRVKMLQAGLDVRRLDLIRFVLFGRRFDVDLSDRALSEFLESETR